MPKQRGLVLDIMLANSPNGPSRTASPKLLTHPILVSFLSYSTFGRNQLQLRLRNGQESRYPCVPSGLGGESDVHNCLTMQRTTLLVGSLHQA